MYLDKFKVAGRTACVTGGGLGQGFRAGKTDAATAAGNASGAAGHFKLVEVHAHAR